MLAHSAAYVLEKIPVRPILVFNLDSSDGFVRWPVLHRYIPSDFSLRFCLSERIAWRVMTRE